MIIDRKHRPIPLLPALVAAGVLDLQPTNDQTKNEAQAIQRKFLETLTGAPLNIWRRRIRRGLTESEIEFIKEKLKE